MCSEGIGPNQARCITCGPLFLHLCMHIMCQRVAGRGAFLRDLRFP